MGWSEWLSEIGARARKYQAERAERESGLYQQILRNHEKATGAGEPPRPPPKEPVEEEPSLVGPTYGIFMAAWVLLGMIAVAASATDAERKRKAARAQEDERNRIRTYSEARKDATGKIVEVVVPRCGKRWSVAIPMHDDFQFTYRFRTMAAQIRRRPSGEWEAIGSAKTAVAARVCVTLRGNPGWWTIPWKPKKTPTGKTPKPTPPPRVTKTEPKLLPKQVASAEWSGWQACDMQRIPITASINIDNNGKITGIRTFVLSRNGQQIEGSFRITGKYDQKTREIFLNAGRWIKRPADTRKCDMAGSFNKTKTVIGGGFNGCNECTEFQLTRNKNAPRSTAAPKSKGEGEPRKKEAPSRTKPEPKPSTVKVTPPSTPQQPRPMPPEPERRYGASPSQTQIPSWRRPPPNTASGAEARGEL